jgi:pyruvate/2-oxoglutarate dehydrogenase complex dihydrolipoamide acyltransferase (E2) component
VRYRSIPLSRPRRFITDLMAAAAAVPTVPVQRRMDLSALAAARAAADPRPGWPALFLKAYAAVAARTPELRRAYVKLPRPRLVEYPVSVASVAVEREYQGEPGVFFGRIKDPAAASVAELDRAVRGFATDPVGEVKAFRQLLRLAGLPGPVRRAALWLGLNLPRVRATKVGTFGLTVYSSLGAESLHPLSPLTTTLNYGVIGADGGVAVRLVYDHRVMDGATVARALAALEAELTGPVLAELRGMAAGPSAGAVSPPAAAA